MEKRSSLDEINDTSARYVVSPKVIAAYGDDTKRLQALIIEMNLDFPGGRHAAVKQIVELLRGVIGRNHKNVLNAEGSRHHVFAELTLQQLRDLLERDVENGKPAIYKVWPDRELEPYLDHSVQTIKADACLRSFGAEGVGIVWAVADSGIDGTHPHFADFDNLSPPFQGSAPYSSPRPSVDGKLTHRDFTGGDAPLTDVYGHGTHVAGIIAGATPKRVAGQDGKVTNVFKVTRERDGDACVRQFVRECGSRLTGVAPKAKLLSLKVLGDNGRGRESWLLSALDFVARTNDDGRWLSIHGINLSLGYPFEAEWFAAGQSPLCVAVNRLVKQGVVVVVAAGNDGSALIKPELSSQSRRVGLDQSISDPGNAEFAITVGSTHPEQPHTYGVSYFSSRGPTADGRNKPDLVAPGERIVSCASAGVIASLRGDQQVAGQLPSEVLATGNNNATKVPSDVVYYREQSGTSMAAPHVSGAIAAFLSVRREFIGQPERIKEIFLQSATDLGRRREFQGSGLVDLMRAMQSV